MRPEQEQTERPAVKVSRRTKRVEETKSEIAEAAAKLFFSRGYREVTMADISREVGMAPASLYYYFRNKEEILRHLDAECVRRFEDFLDSLKAEDDALDKWLLSAIERIFAFAKQNREYFIFLTRLIASAHPALLSEIAENRRRIIYRALGWLTEAMKIFQENKKVRDDVAPEGLAHLVGGLIHSLLFAWFLGMLEEEDLHWRFEVCVRVFCEGAARK